MSAPLGSARALGRQRPHRSATIEDVSDVAFRVLFSVIFVTAGAGHLVRPGVFVERLVAAPLAALCDPARAPEASRRAERVVLLIGGLGLLAGYRTRVASLLLIGVLVPITVVVDLGHTNALGPLFKNVALLGGLVHFAVRGPGAFAVDTAAERAGGRGTS